jgi:nifR3 family TIM-barrel protein
MANERSSTLLRPLSLLSIHLPCNILLAPMAGWTDAAFRRICLEWGAALAYTEMVSAEAIKRDSAKTYSLITRAPEEKHLAVQIFASNASAAGRAVARIRRFRPDLLDLNCGCSVNKICRTGSGAALMREPEKVKEIIRAMCSETDAPVTVKTRSGWDHDSINFIEVAQAAVEGGAVSVCLHPRTKSQLFSGKADWNQIGALKEAVDIPVIGSGDLFTPEDVLAVLEQTNCDGVMIGRGALGNPFLFAAIKAHEPVRRVCEIGLGTRFETALKHIGLAIKIKGERLACRELRKHICAYTKGVPDAAPLRRQIVHASTFEDYQKIIQCYMRDHAESAT